MFVSTVQPDVTAPEVTVTTPTSGSTGIALDVVVSAAFNEDMNAVSISTSGMELRDAVGNRISASIAYNAATRTATLQPASGLLTSTTYTATVHGGASGVRDTAGNAVAADYTWSFTTVEVGTPSANCPCSVWLPSHVPSLASANDPGPVELGLKFRPSVDGFITGVRFYKGAQNVGAHVGNLWTTTGTLLASTPFNAETPSGWQQTTFTTPVAVSANTVYVVSYHAPNGRYGVDAGYFSAGVTNGPLHALANGVAGGNGVFRYGATAFPTESVNSTNYWVDVVFTSTASPGINPPEVTVTMPVANATNVALGTSVTATFTADMNVASIATSSFELRDAGGNLIPTTVSYAAATRTATIQPAALLSDSTVYTATVRGGAAGVRDVAGNVMTLDHVWSFTTGTPPPIALTDTSVAHFMAGTGTGIYVGAAEDGEFMLQPLVGLEFSDAQFPAGWSSTAWTAGGTSTVAGGTLSVDGALASAEGLFGPGRSLEFVATFGSAAARHVGFGLTLNEPLWAMFSTGSGGALYARTQTGALASDTLIPGNWLDAPHRYRVDWGTSTITFWVDGVLRASHNAAIAADMRPLATDFTVGSGSLTLDWLRMTPHATTGTFVSRVLDAGSTTNWGTVSWTATGTGIAMSARFGDTPTPDATWTAFAPVSGSGGWSAGQSRYAQYRADLTGDGSTTPVIRQVTISAADPTEPSMSVGDVSVAEGNAGTTTALFAVQLSHPTAQAVSATYATTDGTGQAPVDYQSATGTVTFAPGTTEASIPVTIQGNSVREPAKMFTLALTAPVNAVLADAQATGTIVNDDPVPQVSIADVTLVEGHSGVTNALFAVTLSGGTTEDVVMSFTTTDGSAVAGSDYTAVSGQLTIPARALSGTISVPVRGDLLDESNETYLVTLSGVTGATILRGVATGTVTDDDGGPSLTIGDVTVTEGDTGTTNAVFTVSLSAASGQTVTVTYATANGTAVAPADYPADLRHADVRAGYHDPDDRRAGRRRRARRGRTRRSSST